MRMRENMKVKTILLTITSLLAAVAIGQAADAKAAWEQHCAKCHGPDGKGKTRMGQKLEVKDFTDPQVQAKLTDHAMAKDIKEGVTVGGKKKMPGFADKLSDEQIKELVQQVRSFARK